MARPKVNHIQLTDVDVKRLKGIMKKKDTNQTTVNRCHVLLAMDENHPPVMPYVQCVETYGISRATIATLVKNQAVVNWQFQTKDARIKLASLYPEL